MESATGIAVLIIVGIVVAIFILGTLIMALQWVVVLSPFMFILGLGRTYRRIGAGKPVCGYRRISSCNCWGNWFAPSLPTMMV
jgi:hypothetical protein